MKILFLLPAFCLLVTCTMGEDPVVETTLGPVRGKQSVVMDDVPLNTFLGIPFAKPPVGDLRFRRPVTPDPWTEPRDAHKLPNACPQSIDESFGRFEGVEMWNPNTDLSEDCLYLNVWAPAGRRKAMPVMVWIYGGSFTTGSSALAVYDGTYLAAANKVIVVSMNYRLGPLGFLHLGDDAPGNVGLLDQRLAMEWVKDNIENFGGVPSRITIFGESAGAASVGFHVLSPLSKGLFNSAIMQSGAPNCWWGVQSEDTHYERVVKLATDLGCPTTDDAAILDCLKQADAQEMSVKAWNVAEYYLDMPFAPIVDGYFLLDKPQALLERGDVNDVAVFLGVNADEGSYFLLYGVSDLFDLINPSDLTRDQYVDVVGRLTAPITSSSEAAEELATEYEQEANGDTYRNILDDVSGDSSFKCCTIEFGRLMSRVNPDVLLYSYEYRLSTNPWPEWAGVMHGYEIEQVFGLPLTPGGDYSLDDLALSRRMMRFWSGFTKNGVARFNPSVWPRYNEDTEEYLIFNTTIKTGVGLRHEQCERWERIAPLFDD